jgi:ribosome biogenesis protein BRX1
LICCRPHSRKEAKLDTKTKLYQLNELAELYNCNNVLFFEARKGQDLYAWMSKAPNGPTVKMHLQNLHTMEELNFIGNCLKGSRPVLSFDAQFEKQAHTRLIKELLTQMFGVPKSARKVKPFVDHVMGFTLADGKIWVRVYQINESEPGKKKPVDGEEMDVDPAPKKKGKTDFDVQLVEIGPRFVLTPIVIQESSFGGPIIYENKEFVSPNQIRSDLRRAQAGKFNSRTEAARDSKIRRGDLGLLSHGGRKKEKDPLSDSVLFA